MLTVFAVTIVIQMTWSSMVIADADDTTIVMC